jgi:predicted nucleic acid-binding protein
MRFLLDSDSLSDLYEPDTSGHAAIGPRFASLQGSDQVFISILAIYEAEYGCANAPESKKASIQKWILEIQEDFEVLPLTLEAARLFGSLKAGLSRIRRLSSKGSKLHSIDIMLAATAIAENCTLISGDSIYADLQKADPMLRVENWLV